MSRTISAPGRIRLRSDCGTSAPEQQCGEDAERLHQRQQGQPGHDAFDHGGQPESGQEAQDHAGQGGHDLDDRLDVGLDGGMHELAHIQRGEQRDGNGEQQRVERPLEGAVNERGQAELGLEVIGAPVDCQT